MIVLLSMHMEIPLQCTTLMNENIMILEKSRFLGGYVKNTSTMKKLKPVTLEF